MKFLVLAISLLSTVSAWAVVDMKTANFSETWIDLAATGAGYDLKVQRTYNSRTIYSGIFGFGWCSDFETRLEVTPENNVKIIECGAGAEIIYAPRKFEANKVSQTVNSIVEEVKKRNQGMSEKAVADLRSDLEEDAYFRENLARRIGLKGTVSKETVFMASGRENETVRMEGSSSNSKENSFRRTLADGTYQLFDGNGRLIAIFDRSTNSLKMQYEKDRLTNVVDNNGRKLTFVYDAVSRRLKRITGPNNTQVDYSFKGEDLKEVTNAWKKKYRYDYDEVHNLVKLTLPDGGTKTLTYNQDKDWVTSFKNEKGCVENYEYKVNSDDPKNHYWSNVVKKCGDKVTNRSTYEFFHRPRADRVGVYLYRVKSDVNGQITDITYHEIFGRPVTIIRGLVKVEYDYNESGMVKSKKEPGRNTSFEYGNVCNKPSKVNVDFFELPSKEAPKAEAKVFRKVATTFTYEPKKCTLTYAENTDGQTVRLQYDVRGRISQIEDQSKKLVKIKYEEKFGKPEVVTRPGLGTLKVVYKGDGEIEKVESKEGPRVAVQVASIFNNLLEIIAPAQTEANL